MDGVINQVFKFPVRGKAKKLGGKRKKTPHKSWRGNNEKWTMYRDGGCCGGGAEKGGKAEGRGKPPRQKTQSTKNKKEKGTPRIEKWSNEKKKKQTYTQTTKKHCEFGKEARKRKRKGKRTKSPSDITVNRRITGNWEDKRVRTGEQPEVRKEGKTE